MRLAGSTAFFTTFALPPILLILIQLLGLLFNRRKISGELFQRLAGFLGSGTVHELVNTLSGLRHLAYNWPIAIGGFLFMLFVATTLFKVIQSSINQLWMIRRTGQHRFGMALRSRLKSALVIVFSGILFIASLLAESLQILLGKYVSEVLPDTGSIYFNNVVSILLSVLVVWIWITVLFRYLPDGKPGWKIAMTGAMITSLFFNAGKYLLRVLLINSNISTLYGTSASIVLLLLFVFYSSFIFYYGAAFTKVWSEYRNQPIETLPNATLYEYADVKT